MKVCSRCEIEKELSLFGKKTSSKDGKRSECKKCQKKDNKEYKDNNKDTVRKSGGL